MTSELPEILKEPRIVSGKYRNETATVMTYSVPVRDLNEPINKKLYIKRQLSLENNATKIDNFNEETKLKQQKQQQQNEKLPNIILNDGSKKRSTSYHRLMRSSDFEKVKNAPIATRLIYNWKPLEHLSTKVVQAKVKLYKPKKKIESTARAPSPYRLQWSWESSEPNLHNEIRAQEMKRIKYMQDHAKWSVYPYGSVEEREDYK
jgi:hypothetical protein